MAYSLIIFPVSYNRLKRCLVKLDLRAQTRDHKAFPFLINMIYLFVWPASAKWQRRQNKVPEPACRWQCLLRKGKRGDTEKCYWGHIMDMRWDNTQLQRQLGHLLIPHLSFKHQQKLICHLNIHRYYSGIIFWVRRCHVNIIMVKEIRIMSLLK